MKNIKVKSYTRQAGMTLIELTVVLLILIGLAGLLVPYVGGFLEKTHDSTTASSLSDLNSTIGRYQAQKLALPDQFDSLVDVGGTTYSKLRTTNLFAVIPGATAPAAPTASTLANASLSKAGVLSVLANNNATADATFKSTIGAPLTLGNSAFGGGVDTQALLQLTGNIANSDQTFFGQLETTLITLTADNVIKNQLAYAFGGSPDSWDTTCTNYIVMGIGSGSSLIPDAMQAAPVHFGGSKGESPTTIYARYVAVFAVPSTGATILVPVSNATPAKACPKPDAPAKFIGSAGVMDFPAIVGLNGAQQWANAKLYE